DGAPLDAAADVPERGERLIDRIGRQAERHPGGEVGSEPARALQNPHAPPEAVERPSPPERVMDERLGRPVARADFVGRGSVAAVPTTPEELDVSALRECGGRHAGQYQNDENDASPQPQSRGAPRRRGGPSGGTANGAD